MRLGGCVDMHVSDANMRPGEIQFRARAFLDIQRLGILRWVVLTFYAARHNIFLSLFC